MIRGTRRQMIVLKTEDSRYFDAAYLLLRTQRESGASERDILLEATRLIGASEEAPHHARPRTRRAFLWGLLCGSLGALLLVGIPLLLALSAHGGIF